MQTATGGNETERGGEGDGTRRGTRPERDGTRRGTRPERDGERDGEEDLTPSARPTTMRRSTSIPTFETRRPEGPHESCADHAAPPARRDGSGGCPGRVASVQAPQRRRRRRRTRGRGGEDRPGRAPVGGLRHGRQRGEAR